MASVRIPTGSLGAVLVLILWIGTGSYDQYEPPHVAPCATPASFTLAHNDTVDFETFAVACKNISAMAIRCVFPATTFTAC